MSSIALSNWHTVLAMAQGMAVISPLAICVAFFSIIGTLSIGISVLPQTIDTMKNQQTQSFATLMYVFLVVGCGFLAIYGIGLVVAGGADQHDYYQAGNIDNINAILSYWLANTKEGAKAASIGITSATITAMNSTVVSASTAYVLAVLLSNTTADVYTNGFASFDWGSFSYAGVDFSSKTDVYANFANKYAVITPSTYQNYKVNFTTPGGLLILGEGFAAITSGIVLYYKLKNAMAAKRQGITEAEYCTKLLEQIKAKKGAK